jgi:two-component system, cell cycle sensor histidine kinase and response regulator CckA
MTIQELISSSELNQFMKYSKQITANTQMMFETVLQLKSNLSIPIEVNACIITVEEKPQILAVCRNISERKKAEEERKRFEKQLITAQKMESLGLLASGIAHDFNNILAALNGYAMLLNSEKAAGNEEIEYLQKINEIVQMGQNLTKRITNFIRKEKEELVIVDIHKVLSDTETLLRTSCREVKLCLDLNAEDAEVLGDETQLQNTFLNLGINALDAMPDGGTLLFTTSNKSSPDRQKDEKEICITVGDTGIGMEPETLYRIFDPLYTTKERDKGTGLGLTSVLYCINNLHGKIDVESVPGRGTTFSIYLPLVRERVLT